MQGYGPVGFDEVRGVATVALADLLARVARPTAAWWPPSWPLECASSTWCSASAQAIAGCACAATATHSAIA
jgi:hypothetical protein